MHFEIRRACANQGGSRKVFFSGRGGGDITKTNISFFIFNENIDIYLHVYINQCRSDALQAVSTDSGL